MPRLLPTVYCTAGASLVVLPKARLLYMEHAAQFVYHATKLEIFQLLAMAVCAGCCVVVQDDDVHFNMRVSVRHEESGFRDWYLILSYDRERIHQRIRRIQRWVRSGLLFWRMRRDPYRLRKLGLFLQHTILHGPAVEIIVSTYLLQTRSTAQPLRRVSC